VPSLDALAAEPAGVAELGIDEVELLIARSVTVQSALLNRLLTVPRRGYETRPESDLYQLDAVHVANLLGVPKDFVYDLIRRGMLPSIKVGRYVRVPGDRLRQWLQDREQEARLLHGDSDPALRGKLALRSRARRRVPPA
jgi:excisionase family DNA binding protein